MMPDVRSDSESDLVRKVLSIHGDFFQQRCLKEVKNSGWKVIAEEYPISSNLFYGSLDIWASLAGHKVNLLIECKKSHPKYKRWIFLSKPFLENFYLPIIKMRKNSLRHDDPKVDPFKGRQLDKVFKSDPDVMPNVQTGFLDAERGWFGTKGFAYAAHEITIDADENQIVKSYERANRPRERPPNERIYHGCHQLSLAMKSIMFDELRLMEKHTYTGMPSPKIFIPILVTNAELLTCEVDAEEVDLTTGEIQGTEETKLAQTNRIAYHFPLPEEFYLYPQDVTGDIHVRYLESASQLDMFKKLFIFVVRSSDLSNFLRDLQTVVQANTESQG